MAASNDQSADHMRTVLVFVFLSATLSAEERFEVAKGFVFEEVLREPRIAQPVSMSFDERGRLWVVEYRQYPYPAGLKVISKDRFWRTVFDKVPEPPPKGAKGKDRISIHEDTDGDGVFDRHSTFLDDLNIATSCARGRGGVFVLNPPYLLFYADKNNDDKPDGPPQVLLQGFGLQDTHSCVNSLTWGPDGWLYAAQGSTVTGNVKRPGDKTARFSMGQLIWRYHPESKRYEVFAEGGGNAYGVEIDAAGRVYSGHNGGNTRGFHYVQGGYYRKGFQKHGALSNPHTFGYFEPMKHAKVPRFTHDFAIYESTQFPPAQRGNLFGVEPLQGRIVEAKISARGSTFATRDLGYPVKGKEKTFRPVAIELGPDGALYVADFREKLISHRDHYQGNITKDDGRMYRLRLGASKPSRPFDLSKLSARELTDVLEHSNRWFRMTALRLMGDRRDKAIAAICRERLLQRDQKTRVDYLWGLNLSGGLDGATSLKLLSHPNPQIRLWIVRLLCDQRKISRDQGRAIAKLAKSENNVLVRSQIASSARRLRSSQGFPIWRELLGRSADQHDPHLPLLYWWGLEKFLSEEPSLVHSLPKSATTPVVSFVMTRAARRFARTGKRADMLRVAHLLKTVDKGLSSAVLKGIEDGLAGLPGVPLPKELISAIRNAGGGSVTLRVRLGDEKALSEAMGKITSSATKLADRVKLMRLIGERNTDQFSDQILKLVGPKNPGDLATAALVALRNTRKGNVGIQVAELLPQLRGDARDAAFELLVSRSAWSEILLKRIAADRLKKDDVPPGVITAMELHPQKSIQERIIRIWGMRTGTPSSVMRARVTKLLPVITQPGGDPKAGRQLYLKSCAKCHVLFGEGKNVGPDLTSFARNDLRRMLINVVNPDSEIREGYRTLSVRTEAGHVVTGFLLDQDNATLTLRSTDGSTHRFARKELAVIRKRNSSLMPEGLLKAYSDKQVRDLFSYLRSAQPLNLK